MLTVMEQKNTYIQAAQTNVPVPLDCSYLLNVMAITKAAIYQTIKTQSTNPASKDIQEVDLTLLHC